MLILVLLLACFLLWFAVTSSRFRWYLIVSTFLFAIAGSAWIFSEDRPAKTKQANFVSAPPAALHSEKMEISAAELIVDNIAVQKPGAESRYYGISGQIRNNSKSATLTLIKMQITVSDCRIPSSCTVVGDRALLIKTDVPPGQTRTFKHAMTRLQGIPVKDNLSWKWAVTASHAE